MKYIAFIFLFCNPFTSIFAQPLSLRIPIWIADSLGAVEPDTLRFGFHPQATDCLDDSLGEVGFPDECGLFNQHCTHLRPPPKIHCTTDFPNFLDLRKWRNANQVDSFQIQVFGTPPVVLHWPQNLIDYFDSCRLYLLLSENPPPQSTYIDMLTIDSAVISYDSTSTRFDARFRTFGPKGLNSVGGTTFPLPTGWSLSVNFPNLFNPSTTFKLHLPNRANVLAQVYNVLGELTAIPVSTVLPAGDHDISWDGRDKTGLAAGSGVYFLQVTTSLSNANHSSSTRKMVLLR